MSKKILWGIAIFLSVIVLVGSGFSLGLRTGKSFSDNVIKLGIENMDGEAEIDFGPFWEAWSEISKNYLKNDEISNEDRLYGAISGLVHSLGDDNSEFLNPQDNTQFQQDIKGNFGGIGAEIGIREKRLVVITPLNNTPAMKSGLKAEDWIVEVDGESTDRMSLLDAVRVIRGPIDSEVVLTIFREEWDEPKEIPIVRANIVIPILESKMVGDIAHISLFSFNSNTERLFKDAVVRSFLAGAKGMVLDLRNNPGGLLNVAVDMGGWFLPRGTVIVSEQGRGGVVVEEYRVNGNESLSDFPVVVLINKGSASASEILAGALRDQRGVKLVGEKSFGKGTVQRLIDLSDGSSLKITVSNWVLPSGHVLEEGINPDVEVVFEGSGPEEGNDPQLTKAIEVLEKDLKKRN